MGPNRMDWHTYLTYLVHSYLQVKCSASLGVLGRKEAAVPGRTPALLSWWEQRIKICRQLHVCACVLCKTIEYWNKFSEHIFVNYYSRIILYIQVCMEKWIQVTSTPLYGPQKSQIQRKSNKIKIESQHITKSIQILFDVIQDCTRYADTPIPVPSWPALLSASPGGLAAGITAPGGGSGDGFWAFVRCNEDRLPTWLTGDRCTFGIHLGKGFLI